MEPTIYAKSIDPGQPAQSAQADPGRNFLLIVNFLRMKRPVYCMIPTVVRQIKFH